MRVPIAVVNASVNHPLLRNGEAAALVGFVFAAVAFLVTFRGRNAVPPSRSGFLSGRYLMLFFARWPLLVVGFVGLVMIAIAVA